MAAADLAVLAVLRPRPQLVGNLAHPSAWVAQAGGDRVIAVLAELALWTVAAWVGLGLLAMLASAAPGAFGRTARGFAQRTVPSAVQRFVAGGLGLSVLLAPAAASAAPARPAAVAPVTIPTPTPNWPVSAPVPTPNWPTQARGTQPRQTTPGGRHHAPERPARRPNSNGTPRTTAATTITVRPGDSLWAIAAEHLPEHTRTPARIAASWPRWYAANRAVIGDDPALIRPGQRLHAPGVDPGRQHRRHSPPGSTKESDS